MKKICILILILIGIQNYVFAESAQSVRDKTRIYGRDYADSQNFEVISVINTIVGGKSVYAVPVLLDADVSIDSASITLDTAGLAGYQQIDNLLKYLSDTIATLLNLNNDTLFLVLNELYKIKGYTDTDLINSDTLITQLNNISDTLNLIYLSSIAADSAVYIRDGISGNADAITESVIEKINPFTKEIIARYEYEYIYNGSGKLIGRILK